MRFSVFQIGARAGARRTTGRSQTCPYVCLLLLLLAVEVKAAEAMILVAPESVVNADRLTLGDIAEVSGNAPETIARLRAINLGYAPNVGTVREIERERVALALSAAGYNERTVKLTAPPVIYVRRASQLIPAGELRTAVENSILAQLRAGGLEATLTQLDLPAAIELPRGTFSARIGTSGVRDVLTSFSVAIDLLVDDRAVRRLIATARVEARAVVALARRDLDSGVRLRAEDFDFQTTKLTRPLAAYVLDAKKLRGTSLRRPLARGEALTSDLLVSEIVVKPGDAVRVVGRSGKLQVMVSGEARSAGRVGDRIQVKNSQSGVTLQATIVDEGEVRVMF